MLDFALLEKLLAWVSWPLEFSVSTNFPFQLGSMARILFSSGGCVANKPELNFGKMDPKNIWLACSAFFWRRCDCSAWPPIFFRALAIPLCSLVNWTADASARYSLCRLTDALIRLPKKSPPKPITTRPSPKASNGIAFFL